jgi:hypothetical protein
MSTLNTDIMTEGASVPEQRKHDAETHIERLARTWRDYADRYDPMVGPEWEDEEDKRVQDIGNSQGNVNEDVTIRLERSIRDVLGLGDDDNGWLPYAPPAETSDVTVDLRSAWNAHIDVIKNVNDLGPRAHARAHDDARIAREDAVSDLVGGPRPAYRIPPDVETGMIHLDGKQLLNDYEANLEEPGTELTLEEWIAAMITGTERRVADACLSAVVDELPTIMHYHVDPKIRRLALELQHLLHADGDGGGRPGWYDRWRPYLHRDASAMRDIRDELPASYRDPEVWAEMADYGQASHRRDRVRAG